MLVQYSFPSRKILCIFLFRSLHSLYSGVYFRHQPNNRKGEEWKENMTYHSRVEKYVSKATTSNGNSTVGFFDTFGSNAPDGLITKQALCRLFDCSGRTIERMVARCVLPPPIRLAGKRVWQAGTLGAWLADAAKQRQAAIETEAARIHDILSDRWNN